MKKTWLLILCAISICACRPTPEQRAKQFILDRAVDPSSIRILSHSEVLRPELTKQDTFYHVSALGDGIAYSDSIRVETYHQPEHYYCYWRIEGNDSTDSTCSRSVELAVMADGEVIFFDKYRDRYYGSIASETFAQYDTLAGVRTPGFYTKPNVWALKQMLIE